MMAKEKEGIRIDSMLSDLEPRGMTGTPAGPVLSVTSDSRRVEPGALFVALRGFRVDGHNYLREAAARGAIAAVVEEPDDTVDLPQIAVADSRVALGVAADIVCGHPSRSLSLLGVTGTNGKTTVIHIMESIFRAAGRAYGLIGTLAYRWGETSLEAVNTTPAPDTVHSLLSRMREDKVDAVGMEVSSHAIALRRLSGLAFEAVALTNITRDHLDFHNTLDEYRGEKMRLFHPGRVSGDKVEVGRAVLNLDDPYGKVLASESPLPVTTFSLREDADLTGSIRRTDEKGSGLHLRWKGEETDLFLPIPGECNASNALAASALALGANLSLADVSAGLAAATPPAGRMERVAIGQPFTVIIDYAHTPDGMTHLLQSVGAFTDGRVILLFGCGGERDEGKRALMGEIAGEGADRVVLTDDNPRGEDPAEIRSHVEKGLRRADAAFDSVAGRREAIAHALRLARPGDVVLLAGKGHEKYQIIGGERLAWNERTVVEELIRESGGRGG